MSPKYYVGDLNGEEIVLAYIETFRCGVQASQLDSYMLSVGEESLSVREISEALERCRQKGDVERDGQSIWFYRITDKGRVRLAGGRS